MGGYPDLYNHLGHTADSLSEKPMNERRASNPSPVPRASTSVPPQATNRPYRAALLFAFAASFLWNPLGKLLQQRLGFSNAIAGLLLFVPIVIAFAILYPSGLLQEKRRAARVCKVFAASVALLGCAMCLWVGLLLFLIGRGL